MADQKRVLEGVLKLWEQEGGHCDSSIEVGDEQLTHVLSTLLGETTIDLERLRGDDRPRVRITIEVLDDDR